MVLLDGERVLDKTTATEKAKYERMWAVEAYSKNSPGLTIAPTALRELDLRSGDTLLDFGAGRGVAVDWFRERGIDATGIDLVPLRPDITEACLWNLPPIASVDYGFCADVMEHIPLDKVDDVLAGIRRLVTKGAFFQIATRPDRMGALIGETLHLTVQPKKWWVDKLREHFQVPVIGDGAVDWQFWAVCR